MTNRKHRGAGFVAAGWGILLALGCSIEQLADTLGGWCIVFGGIAVAFALMRAGESAACRNPSATAACQNPSTTAARRSPSLYQGRL